MCYSHKFPGMIPFCSFCNKSEAIFAFTVQPSTPTSCSEHKNPQQQVVCEIGKTKPSSCLSSIAAVRDICAETLESLVVAATHAADEVTAAKDEVIAALVLLQKQ
mmetsp:Transcript_34543/g.43641  ORF Transcript_34543/g.43641 Transcript_34543/m.43641 type:complete len:105 (-) Transcript_34543:36-350(-)